jgi:polyketide biosynthesis enoyl-CoA hydratase PksH
MSGANPQISLPEAQPPAAFETLSIKENYRQLTVRISRPERDNSINSTLVRELHSALDLAEAIPDCRTLVLEGFPGVFCTGLDLQEAATADVSATETVRISEYMRLLQRFTTSRCIVICRVDGRVTAGGVGLVAACDITVATERSEFSLSEALWGLLPCCVTPFLLRRVGYQKAYFLTLTTRTITASEAYAIHLVDELTNNLDDALRRLGLRLNLLDDRVILDLKRYFQVLAGITPDMEQTAIQEIARLAAQPYVQQNIRNFIQRGLFPWEKGA